MFIHTVLNFSAEPGLQLVQCPCYAAHYSSQTKDKTRLAQKQVPYQNMQAIQQGNKHAIPTTPCHLKRLIQQINEF